MLSRRRFLKVMGVGGGTAAVVGCGEKLDFTPKVGRWDVGVPDEYAEGDLRYFDDGPILVGRDAGGIYAMSAICTHRACPIGDDAEEIDPRFDTIQCDCHQSEYTRTGEPSPESEGPATRTLQHYQVTLEDGRLIADTGAEVDLMDRLLV